MKTKKLLNICMMYSLAFFATLQLNAQADNRNNFSNLHSLEGTWIMKTDKGLLFESWQIADDSTLTSKSFIIKSNDTTMLEHVELKLRDNNIYYVPTVPHQNDQQPVIFTLVKLKNGAFTFENKQHDYPQRIIYELPQNNHLHAWIEGKLNGREEKEDYNYTKVLP